MILFNLKSIRDGLKNSPDCLFYDSTKIVIGESLFQCFDMGGGDGGSTESEPNYSEDEQQMFDKAANNIRRGLSRGANPYKGKTLADTPEEFGKAIDTYQNYMNQFTGSQDTALQRILGGESSFEYNPAQTTKMWDETYATPAMSMWDKEVAPVLREGMAGGIFSTRAPQMIGREKTKFYNESILPSLFTAQQSDKALGASMGNDALARMMQGIGMPNQLSSQRLATDMGISQMIQGNEQAKLTDLQTRWQSAQAESNPFLQLAIKYRTGAQPSYETVGFQGSDPWAGIFPALIGAGGMMGAAAISKK